LDEEYQKYAKGRDVTLCPECKSRVEKDTGCNHMTCPYIFWLNEFIILGYVHTNGAGCVEKNIQLDIMMI